MIVSSGDRPTLHGRRKRKTELRKEKDKKGHFYQTLLISHQVLISHQYLTSLTWTSNNLRRILSKQPLASCFMESAHHVMHRYLLPLHPNTLPNAICYGAPPE